MVSLKYAVVERERRYLLEALPDLPGARVLRITDRYLDGTRLRLRRVDEDGCAVVLKLGQKVPVPDGIGAQQAAMVEPLACVLQGLHTVGGVDASHTAVVFGCGTLVFTTASERPVVLHDVPAVRDIEVLISDVIYRTSRSEE